MHQHDTFVRPGAQPADVRAPSSGFPTDLLEQSARRLRILALLYSFVFLMAGVVSPLAVAADRQEFLQSPLHQLSAALGIGTGLLVAAAIRSPRISLATAMNLGLAFEIAGSFAIAGAEFAHAATLEEHRGMLGLSWVSVWVVLFTIVVPTQPRRAVLAALASGSSVAVVIGLMIVTGATTFRIAPGPFFFGLIFPYLLVAMMAYVGARVVYQLGKEVKRARELGNYQLEQLLGQGGMGEVWRARHLMLARPAAIKLIRPVLAAMSEEMGRRFEREAQVTASLRSPHTVTLFDFGVAIDGTRYYVMELLDGLDTDSLLRRFGPLPAERVVPLLRQVCHSLSEAHARGLVHRDIKPANIFLCRYGEEYDFVKVLDFGIVRASGDSDDRDRIRTRENAVQGTPAFIAPEQAMGDAVDGRADIYSTGCLAYWLLTGQLVFDAATPMALVMQHAQKPPVAPSARTDRPISRALDELVLACLAKDPADRPQSAADLSRRLAELDSGEWTQERARQWWAELPSHHPPGR